MSITQDILKLIIPETFPMNRYDLEGVEFIKNEKDNNDIYREVAIVHLKEKNIPPDGYVKADIESLGFAKPKQIKDLPIRNRLYTLKVTKRRWKLHETGKTVKSDLPIIYEGTRITVDAASFFKERNR